MADGVGPGLDEVGQCVAHEVMILEVGEGKCKKMDGGCQPGPVAAGQQQLRAGAGQLHGEFLSQATTGAGQQDAGILQVHAATSSVCVA